MRGLFLEDYANQYEDLLLDVQLAPFSNLQEATSILNVLSQPEDSPLLLLLQAVERETTLHKLEDDAGLIRER